MARYLVDVAVAIVVVQVEVETKSPKQAYALACEKAKIPDDLVNRSKPLALGNEALALKKLASHNVAVKRTLDAEVE